MNKEKKYTIVLSISQLRRMIKKIKEKNPKWESYTCGVFELVDYPEGNDKTLLHCFGELLY